MTPAITLTTATPVPLAVVRRVVRQAELSRIVPDNCGLVWNFARSRGLAAGRHVAVYLDDQITVEVGVEVTGTFQGADEVRPSTTPGGLAASLVHHGPYHTLGGSHEALHRWAQATGHRLTGRRWEIYGHWQDDWNRHPERIMTEIWYQVEPS